MPGVLLLQLLKMIQDFYKGNEACEHDCSKSRKRKCNMSNDPAFLISNIVSPTLKPPSKHDVHRYDSLTSRLSTETFQFKSQITWLYRISTPYKISTESKSLQ